VHSIVQQAVEPTARRGPRAVQGVNRGNATIEHGAERRSHLRVVVHDIELIGVRVGGSAVVEVV